MIVVGQVYLDKHKLDSKLFNSKATQTKKRTKQKEKDLKLLKNTII